MNLQNLNKLAKGGRYPLSYFQNDLFFEIIKKRINENHEKRFQQGASKNK
jgi:hypothetical protein